jgi:predicted transcriptional regulator
MTSLEFQKEQLQKRINDIDDEKLLQKILNLVNEEAPEYKLTETQKESILKGKKDIEEGRFTTNNQLQKEVRKWLKK